MTCNPFIVRTIEPFGGAAITDAPLPANAYVSVKLAAQLVGIARKTIQNDLSRMKDRFDEPTYALTPGGAWNERLISGRDVQTLRNMYPRQKSWMKAHHCAALSRAK